MNVLPSGWEPFALGELGTEVRGSVAPVHGTTYELYSVPAFPTGAPEVRDGSSIGSAKRPVQPGDLLLCKINPRINRVWIVSQPLGVGPQIASPEYLILRTPNRELARYLRWYLSSPAFRDWITLSVEGATGSHTRAKSGPILKQLVPVAPSNEQQRIVAVIEEHFSRMDAADASLRLAHRRLSVLRTLLLRAATGGTHPTTALADVAEIVSGQTPKGLKPLAEGPVPFFKVDDMNAASGYEMAGARAYLDDALIARFKMRVRPAGTVIFPKRGGAIATNKKRILLEPAAFDLNTMGLVPSEALVPKFLLYWLETKDLASLADGSNVPQINVPDVAPLQVPIPPIDEQHRVVEQLDAQLSTLDAAQRTVERTELRNAALRRSILEQAFTGKLLPQDPSDEPASVLLERIAAEQARAPESSRRKRMISA